jgi:hypothetical protein
MNIQWLWYLECLAKRHNGEVAKAYDAWVKLIASFPSAESDQTTSSPWKAIERFVGGVIGQPMPDDRSAVAVPDQVIGDAELVER